MALLLDCCWEAYDFNGFMLLRNGTIAMPLDPDAADYLENDLKLLLEGDFQVRWEATKRLTAMGQPAIARLIPLVEDDTLDWEVRWFAARALGAFDTNEALVALIELLQQPQEAELIAIAAEGLSRFEEKGIEALAKLLEQPAHSLTAIRALASIRHTAVLTPLLTYAQDPNPAVRAVIISALGNFRTPEADALLIEAVKDPVAAVRQEAVVNLGLRSHLLETQNLVDILLAGLWDVNLGVSRATAIALGRLGTETAVTSLSRVLTSPHTPEPLQITIIQALGWIEKESALLALLSARQQVALSVQIQIIEVLERLKAPHLRQLAGEILVDWLQSLMVTPGNAPPLKRAIALTLGRLRTEQARSSLHTLATDPDAQTRLYAEAALRQLNQEG
jgi:HEAT repeat protein